MRGAAFVQRVVTINAGDATASSGRTTKQNASLSRTNEALESADETTSGARATKYNIYSSQAGSEPAAEPVIIPLPPAQTLQSSRRKLCATFRSTERKTGWQIPDLTTNVELAVMSEG